VTNTVRLFLLDDPAFVAYMVLLAAVLGSPRWSATWA